VENIEFVTAESIEPLRLDAWGDYLVWDTVLGFAPFDADTPPENPWDDPKSIWRAMVEGGESWLENNIFSLKFDDEHGGELRLGEIDEDFNDGEFTKFPLAKEAISRAQWMFDSTNSSMEVNGHLLPMDDVKTIRLSTVESKILLPPLVAEYLNTIVGSGQVNCYQIAQFPKLHLDLGGRVLELTGEDYTMRAKSRYWGDTCFSAIGVSETEEIVLGNFAMRSRYWVFDVDGKAVNVTKTS